MLCFAVQFDWEEVKEDTQGQNYLGHSVKAANGRSVVCCSAHTPSSPALAAVCHPGPVY